MTLLASVLITRWEGTQMLSLPGQRSLLSRKDRRPAGWGGCSVDWSQQAWLVVIQKIETAGMKESNTLSLSFSIFIVSHLVYFLLVSFAFKYSQSYANF